MDGTAGDEPEVSNAELWRRLKAAQKAYDEAETERRRLSEYRSKAHTFNSMVSQIANLKKENASLRKRLERALDKVAAQRELVEMAKKMVSALKANARQS